MNIRQNLWINPRITRAKSWNPGIGKTGRDCIHDVYPVLSTCHWYRVETTRSSQISVVSVAIVNKVLYYHGYVDIAAFHKVREEHSSEEVDDSVAILFQI